MKILKFLLLIPVLFLIVGCNEVANYSISLDKVSLLSPIKKEFTNLKTINNNSVFNDEMIKINWILRPQEFGFTLTNLTTDSMEIVWDKCAYVDIEGRTHRLIHKGVKYTDRNNSQPNSIVLPNSSIDDIVYPADYVYYKEGEYGGWMTPPLFDFFNPNALFGSIQDKKIVKKNAEKYIGKTVQGLLTIKSNEIIYNYVFAFSITSCEVTKR